MFYNCGQFHNRSNCVINLDLVDALFYIFFIRMFLATCMLSHNWSCQTYGTIARNDTLPTCLRNKGGISLSYKNRFSKLQKCMCVVMNVNKKSNFPYWKRNFGVVYASSYFKVNIWFVNGNVHRDIIRYITYYSYSFFWILIWKK